MARKKANRPKAAKPKALGSAKPRPPKPDVEAIRHKDTRKNIPTEELRDFVADDEAQPKKLLYPRDPSLDPQLVWKGKDEQDRQDLAVDVVPIYIQEVIEPRVIIEAAQHRKKTEPDNGGFLTGFFDDMSRIDFEKRIEFYHHDQQWANRLILGDSLYVMTSLAEKEGLRGKVQTIYFDPPYGIKFGSNWQVSTRKRDVKDGKAEDATRQPEQIRAFRDTWKLGIHSYLTYLRDRLAVARELLTETGSVFVQIGDQNVHLVRSLLDEIFGSENYCGLVAYKTTSGLASDFLANAKDYICWYCKDRRSVKFRRLFLEKVRGEEGATQFGLLESPDGKAIRKIRETEDIDALMKQGWELLAHDNLTSTGFASTTAYDAEFAGRVFKLPAGNVRWKTTREGMERLALAGRLMVVGNTLRFKRYFKDFSVFPLVDVWNDTGISGFSDKKKYVVETNQRVIERCVLMTSDPGDLVLDPTCGSGTTAWVAEEWGRRWITIDTSRVALALARTLVMAARYPYYLLADSPEGVKKEAELTGQQAPNYPTAGDIRKGFVCKRVPHVTLRSIANNPDLREGMSRKAIDAAIARHAETETLYDRPYEDNARVRVSGPFTVESLSPDRIVSTDEERPTSEILGRKQPGRTDFVAMILDNLRKAGVKNPFKAERLTFDRLEPFAGRWIQAAGEYSNGDGKRRRVAVTIGPEFGTVTPQQVKEAAKEAVQGIGFDILVVCGFAFDPHAAEEAKRYGKLTILSARMNPDLAMGGELLKKTGAGNLFMVFGEPDIKLNRADDGKLIVEIKGVDVYDPTTGEVRNSSTDDIACWFVDTDYNGECFFVRHAYFLGADDPYGKLKRALRAEIDEAQWATLYSTKSYPFDPPSTGRIAVKVINHYGDEVLKVYSAV